MSPLAAPTRQRSALMQFPPAPAAAATSSSSSLFAKAFSAYFFCAAHTHLRLCSLARLLSRLLARSHTHLYVRSLLLLLLLLLSFLLLFSLVYVLIICAAPILLLFRSFSFLCFALPIRYSLLVLSFAHGICFCMTLTLALALASAAFAASFYVLKTANLLQLCRTRRRGDCDGNSDGNDDDKLLAQRRQDETMTENETKRKTSTRNKRKALPTKTTKLQFPITHIHSRDAHTIIRWGTAAHENSVHLFSRIHTQHLQTFICSSVIAVVVASHWQGALCLPLLLVLLLCSNSMTQQQHTFNTHIHTHARALICMR